MRLNSFSAEWERQFEFAGLARSLARTSAGALLLHTSAGVYRRDPDGTLTMAWNAPADGLAVMGERVAVAWNSGNTWQVAESADGGQGWGPADQITVGAPPSGMQTPGALGPAYPVLAADGLLEVVGCTRTGTRRLRAVRAADRRAAAERRVVPAAWRARQSRSWQPRRCTAGRRLAMASSERRELHQLGRIGFNGATDIYATTR
jgi:hypothetical protein